MIRKVYHNLGAPAALPPDAPQDAVKGEFARRLQERLIAKGMRQSDLARATALHMPKDTKFGRDSVSIYIRGKSLPGPTSLAAMAKALDCKPEDLMPSRGLPSANEASPSLDAKELADGNVWLRVNQAVPWDVAISVMSALKVQR